MYVYVYIYTYMYISPSRSDQPIARRSLTNNKAQTVQRSQGTRAHTHRELI